MGKKIKKEKILNDIQNKINICLEYQKHDPDLSASDRIKKLKNDPCGDLKYFVNVTLKDCLSNESTNLSDRLKFIENNRYLLTISELNDLFEIGCLITVRKKSNNGFSYDVVSYNDFSKLCKDLIGKYFDETCFLTTLNPKKPILGNNYIEEDTNLLNDLNKTNIVYSIGRFNLKSFEKLLKEKINTEKYDLYSFSTNNFHEVKYIDMTKITSLEQNVNQFFENTLIMNNVTLFGSKTRLPNYNLKKEYGIFDLGRYINLTLDEIKKCDDAQIQKKYNLYSKNIFKDLNVSKYDMYKDHNGGDEWNNWSIAQKQFLTFKSISSYDTNFKNEALNNIEYLNNLYAYEYTANTFSNIKMECISYSWKKETDLFKKKKIDKLFFIDNPNNSSKINAIEELNEFLIDPPSIVVKPLGNSKIKFSKNIKYDFNINILLDTENLTNKNFDKRSLISDPGLIYENVKGYFNSKNIIYINRENIKLDGIEYVYTPVKIEIDKINGKPFENEITKKNNIYLIPENSYYNNTLKLLFDSYKLDERIIQTTVDYSIIPKMILIPIKFIQHSCWENIDPAEEAVKKLKEQYENNYLRISIDTISYDPWEKIISKFEKIYSLWNNLEADKDGFFEFPPIGKISKESENVQCSFCKNKMKDCKCEKLRLCTKCFPIDINGSYDINEKCNFNLFNINSYIYDINNNPMTYLDIAKEIFHSLYPSNDSENIKDYISFSEKSLIILNSSYDNIINSRSYNLEGSPLSQFSNYDFEYFKYEYVKKLFTSYDSINDLFKKQFQVGLMDGLLYIPVGYDILFEYDINLKEFIILGTDHDITNLASFLTKCSGDEYNKLALSIMDLYDEDNIPENLKKFIVYPYIPNINSLINGNNTNQNEYIKEFNEDYIYKVDRYDLENLKLNKKGLSKIPIRFSIYHKIPIKCSYPRCVDPNKENEFNDGKCGLDEYFKTPITTNLSPFSFKKELKKRMALRKVNDLKLMTKNLIKNILNIKSSSCNSTKNLELIEIKKTAALNDLYKFGNEYENLLSLVPNDPLNSNSGSLICLTSKKSKLKSIMIDYNEVFTHSINTILTLKDDEYNLSEIKFNSIIKNLTMCSDAISNYFDELVFKSENYNMCNIKFSEYIENSNGFKLLNKGMAEKEKTEMSNILKNEIKKRITNNIILENIKDMDLDENDSKELAKMISNNDINSIKAFSTKNKKILESKIKSSNDSNKNLKNVLLGDKNAIKKMEKDKKLIDKIKNNENNENNENKLNNNKDDKSYIDLFLKTGKKYLNKSIELGEEMGKKCLSLLNINSSINSLNTFLTPKNEFGLISKNIFSSIESVLDPKSIDVLNLNSFLDPSKLNNYKNSTLGEFIGNIETNISTASNIGNGLIDKASHGVSTILNGTMKGMNSLIEKGESITENMTDKIYSSISNSKYFNKNDKNLIDYEYLKNSNKSEALVESEKLLNGIKIKKINNVSNNINKNNIKNSVIDKSSNIVKTHINKDMVFGSDNKNNLNIYDSKKILKKSKNDELKVDEFKLVSDDFNNFFNEDKHKNEFIKNSEETLNTLDNNLTNEVNNILNSDNESLDMSLVLSKKCQNFGNMTKNITGSINGNNSNEIKNQNSSQVNNMLLDEEDSKVNISNDIIISMYQFIDESCDDYEKLTNEHISLD